MKLRSAMMGWALASSIVALVMGAQPSCAQDEHQRVGWTGFYAGLNAGYGAGKSPHWAGNNEAAGHFL